MQLLYTVNAGPQGFLVLHQRAAHVLQALQVCSLPWPSLLEFLQPLQTHV